MATMSPREPSSAWSSVLAVSADRVARGRPRWSVVSAMAAAVVDCLGAPGVVHRHVVDRAWCGVMVIGCLI